MSDDDVSRRRFLRRAGWTTAAVVAPAAAGYVGYSWPRTDAEPATAGTNQPSGTDQTPDVHHFVSRPDLTPPRLSVADGRGGDELASLPRSPGYLTLAPKGYPDDGPGQRGCLLANRMGQPVWFLPREGENEVPMDFKVQTYRGEPVLTWWQGTVHEGYGTGKGVIYDSSYRKVAEVNTGDDVEDADLHEFLLTDDGTALLMAYQPHAVDLSELGGPTRGWAFSGVVQEVDVETGKVVSHWDSIDHVDLTEAYTELADTGSRKTPFDYFHINAIDLDDDGDLLVSARNTWAIYKISRRTGEVIWRLGGKKSDFTLGANAEFYWQHDARWLSKRRMSLFDNAAAPPQAERSRGLILDLDTQAMRADVVQEYVHPTNLLADNQGNMQVLSDRRVIIGWGAQPYASEYTSDGELLRDWRFPAADQTYRAYSFDWTGTPDDAPAVGVTTNPARGFLVYASWNGATDVRRWRILAGANADDLTPVATMPRSGFETAVAVNADGPFFAAVALDKNGRVLGTSDTVRSEQ